VSGDNGTGRPSASHDIAGERRVLMRLVLRWVISPYHLKKPNGGGASHEKAATGGDRSGLGRVV
jgi:hypothetical protein